jgi:hypothetical protein
VRLGVQMINIEADVLGKKGRKGQLKTSISSCQCRSSTSFDQELFPKLDNLFGTLGSLSKASEKSPIDGISTIYFVSHSVAIHQVPPALVLR